MKSKHSKRGPVWGHTSGGGRGSKPTESERATGSQGVGGKGYGSVRQTGGTEHKAPTSGGGK